MWNFTFFLNNILLGVGLSMDAFSVSLANGFNEPTMKKSKRWLIAGMFSFFQGLMPFLGWVLVHSFVTHFEQLENFIPYIALILLAIIGGKMIYEYFSQKDEEQEKKSLGFLSLFVQGIATSIDALSVGVTNSQYGVLLQLVSSLIIASITLVICFVGVIVGQKFGTKFSKYAQLIGGIILVLIGLEIFISGVFF